MRPIFNFGLILLAAAPLLAQTQPTLARVKAGSATVRSAPGENSPETGRLESGAEVTVVAPEGADWFAIQPPVGSISWIGASLLEPQGSRDSQGNIALPFNAVVRAEKESPALIRAGQIGVNKPLAVQRTKLPEGTIVQVVGRKVKLKTDGDEIESSWYPILAPRDDYRYIRRESVELSSSQPTTGFIVKSGGTSSKALPEMKPSEGSASRGDFPLSLPNPDGRPQLHANGPSRAKPADWPNNYSAWKEAEKARGAGENKLAEEYYSRLAKEVGPEGPSQDVELANLCYDRIYLMKNPGGGSGSAWRPQDTNPRLEAAPKINEEKKAKSASGTLKPTKAQYSSRAIYVLVNAKNQAICYVVSGGIDLEKYLDRWVEISGEETKSQSFLGGETLLVASQIDRAK